MFKTNIPLIFPTTYLAMFVVGPGWIYILHPVQIFEMMFLDIGVHNKFLFITYFELMVLIINPYFYL